MPRAKLHRTYPIERLNGEIKRRTDVVGIFPNDEAIVHLVVALPIETKDERAVARRCMALESLARINDAGHARLPAAAA